MSGAAAVAAGLLIMGGLLGIGLGLRRVVPRPRTRPAEGLLTSGHG